MKRALDFTDDDAAAAATRGAEDASSRTKHQKRAKSSSSVQDLLATLDPEFLQCFLAVRKPCEGHNLDEELDVDAFFEWCLADASTMEELEVAPVARDFQAQPELGAIEMSTACNHLLSHFAALARQAREHEEKLDGFRAELERVLGEKFAAKVAAQRARDEARERLESAMRNFLELETRLEEMVVSKSNESRSKQESGDAPSMSIFSMTLNVLESHDAAFETLLDERRMIRRELSTRRAEVERMERSATFKADLHRFCEVGLNTFEREAEYSLESGDKSRSDAEESVRARLNDMLPEFTRALLTFGEQEYERAMELARRLEIAKKELETARSHNRPELELSFLDKRVGEWKTLLQKVCVGVFKFTTQQRGKWRDEAVPNDVRGETESTLEPILSELLDSFLNSDQPAIEEAIAAAMGRREGVQGEEKEEESFVSAESLPSRPSAAGSGNDTNNNNNNATQANGGCWMQ